MSLEVPVPAPASGGKAGLVLVLGILGLLGSLGSCCCCLFLVLALCAPIAWFLGRQELQAIREGRSPASGESNAKAGMILGIVGTALLGLYFVGVAIYVALVGASGAFEALKHGGSMISR